MGKWKSFYVTTINYIMEIRVWLSYDCGYLVELILFSFSWEPNKYIYKVWDSNGAKGME